MTYKVIINSNPVVTLTCPKCGRVEQKDRSTLMQFKPFEKIEFTCGKGHSFNAVIEKRQSFRKEVHLKGSLIKNLKKYPVVVENISTHGIRVKMIENFEIENGQKIEIEFTLDDSNNTKISKKALAKRFLSPLDVGCEFIDKTNHGILEDYFLS